MTNEKLYEAIGDISEKHINDAKQVKKTKRTNWMKWSAIAACFVMVAVFGIVVLNNKSKTTPNDVAEVTDNDTSVQGEPTSMGKMMINFEGRVIKVEQGSVTLDNGKVVKITENTNVTSPDGSFAEIAEGDYIQGYAQNPEESEIIADYILITPL